MSIESISLRKLLRIMYSEQNKRISLLRADIRDEIAKSDGEMASGGDFHVPFWSDAKEHAIGRGDLHTSVDSRIAANKNRENLYPQLRDGFLAWWNKRRRWTNGPFEQFTAPRGKIEFPEIYATVKIANFLALRDASKDDHLVYPYFSHSPSLTEEAGRLALWAIGEARVTENNRAIVVLDVIRGTAFSLETHPLNGNERSIFESKYRTVIAQWNKLWDEYE